MKGIVPAIFIVCALVATLFSLFGEDGFSRKRILEQNLAAQKERNEQLEKRVSALKAQIAELRIDDRALEKAARNGLGVARAGDVVVLFDRLNREEELPR